MESLEEEFAYRGIKRGGIIKFRPEVALEIVREARKRQIEITGIDGFYLTASTTQPSMANSVILDRTGDKCWDMAEQFLEKYQFGEMFFEVGLDE